MNSKPIALSLVVVSVGCLLHLPAPGQSNLVVDPGFENWTNAAADTPYYAQANMPTGWARDGNAGRGSHVRNTLNPYAGTNCFQLNSSISVWTAIWYEVPTTSNRYYTVSWMFNRSCSIPNAENPLMQSEWRSPGLGAYAAYYWPWGNGWESRKRTFLTGNYVTRVFWLSVKQDSYSNPSVFLVDDVSIVRDYAVWTGVGGTNLSVGLTNNWLNGLSPLNDGTDGGAFGSGGDAATIDGDLVWYGMTINRAGDFTLNDGGGSLALGGGGVTTEGSTGTYAIALTNLKLFANSVWNVQHDLSVSSAIAEGGAARGLTKRGAGTLTLSGTNTFSGATVVEEGILSVTHREALSDATAVRLVPGTKLKLDFTGAPLVVGTLYVNGELQVKGKLYTPSNLGAYLEGTGSLLPQNGDPAPGLAIVVR
ncbi:MAG: autotransporter-associated beta strand repeat-containing protein [Kiritimatiellae bacterium]|nr:autotransporter-associated beta strand repeat-containing protein [Kiritimatiellia bacterium]